MGCCLSLKSKCSAFEDGKCSAKNSKDQDVNIVVCSNSGEKSVQGFIQYINKHMPDIVQQGSVKFKPFPYNMKDMKKFSLKGIDALLLCHSVDIKGHLRTDDGPNSIYHKFLHKAKNCLGKKKVAVVVHDYDMPREALETYSNKNKSMFNMTSLVLTLGKLAAGAPIDLTNGQLDELKSFFQGALSCRRKIVGAFYRVFYRIIRQ